MATLLSDPGVKAARIHAAFSSGISRFLFGLVNLATLVALLILFSYQMWDRPMLGISALTAGLGIALYILRHSLLVTVLSHPVFDPDTLAILAQTGPKEALRERLISDPKVQYFLTKAGEAVSPSKDSFEEIVEKAKHEAIRQRRKATPIDLLIPATTLRGDEVKELLSWDAEQSQREQKSRLKFDPENLGLTGGFAKDWAAGYTVLLDRYSHDLTLVAKREATHLVGRGEVVESLEEVLSKSSHSHAVLVGDPGVGKGTVVWALAQKIAKGRSTPSLSMRHLKAVDLSALLAGTSPEDFEVRLIRLLNEAARAGNITLFFPNIELILGGGQDAGSGKRTAGVVDASAVLARYLEAGVLQLVATTSWEGFHQTIEKNPSLLSKFTKIEVKEPVPSEVSHILLDASVPLENRYRLVVTYPAILEVVRLSGRYLKDAPFPEKAINLLEEVCVAVSTRRGHKVTPEDVQGVVSRRTKIPVGKALPLERQALLRLEDKLHQRIVDQVEAISQVSGALRRSRAGLKRANRPIGAFLFLGPTGVGKTETAKAVAWAYFGSDHAMERVDFQEYATDKKVDQLQGYLATRVRENPYTVVLIDEVEKGSTEARNLLLSLLDEGRLSDENGKPVDFTNTIIIATSNAGAEFIRESIKAKVPYDKLKNKLLDLVQKKDIFSTEFLNRFDGVLVFKPLGPAEVVAVVGKIVADLNRTLSSQKVSVEIDEATAASLAKAGFDPVFGARALRRIVQEKVENVVARKLLEGSLKEGETLTLRVADLQ